MRALPDAVPDSLPVALVVAVAFVGSAFAAGVGPFAPDPAEPTPTVETLEITDRGCRGELREFGHSRNGPNGTYVSEGIIDAASPVAGLSATALRTSPENAEVLTYRVDVRTHEPANATTDCEDGGEVAYRLVANAPDGLAGERLAVYVDGRIASCGGGTYGPNTGCGRLMTSDSRSPAATTNESVTGPVDGTEA